MSGDSGAILREPPVAGDEVATLLGSLERQRRIFAWKCGGRRPSLRRLLIDRIEQYARHAGRADLIREAVDGLVGEDLPE